MSKLVAVASAVSLLALGACVSTAPAPPAPMPTTTVVTPPAPVMAPPAGSTVVVPGRY